MWSYKEIIDIKEQSNRYLIRVLLAREDGYEECFHLNSATKPTYSEIMQKIDLFLYDLNLKLIPPPPVEEP